MKDLDLPIALRRGRRCSSRIIIKSEERPAVSAAPRTPHGRKKGVRYSDTGPSVASSGLTPMVRRTCIATPKGRRLVDSIRSAGGSRLASSTTTQGSTQRADNQPACLDLRQTVDGRIERRMRRNGLRDMLYKIEQEKRRKEQSARAQIAMLEAEITARDAEIYELQNATAIVDTDRIWDLEQQIGELKDELATRRSLAKEDATQRYSWAKASNDALTEGLMDLARDGDHCGDTAVLQSQASTSTPSRARSPFLTPPSTSPPMPASPCSRGVSPTAASHADIQAHFLDSDTKRLEEEIASLRFKVHKLTTSLDSYNALGARISDALSNGPPEGARAEAFFPLEAIEDQVQLLLQTMSDRAAAVTHLTAAIGELGFPGSDAGEMISSLASGFRAARLELEYLTPGEITLPLASRGAEVLDLLLARLRAWARKAKEDEDSIDEYHAIEQSLRRQLDSRTSVTEELNGKIAEAYRMLDGKGNRIRELEVGNDRLKGAADGYVRDIAELEQPVERVESEHRESTGSRPRTPPSPSWRLRWRRAVAQTAELRDEIDSGQ
ncbi:glycolipid 2-alpha-mannosyltransferase [Trichoderma cornu-damae]|uniref:Glycolipid 2-alpha-mannosyltransferase n=1 Tax=Trichoderma cornu-damae TaxID=654480 RepID=A0A9P8TUS6_9HYPO|nr:glycolipid 2-alpha-mannosyltransferase [Trichoderma cornu-damae]